MSIIVPDSTTVTTPLQDIVDQINRELENYPIRGMFSAEGDGEQTSYHLPPPARNLVDDDEIDVTLDGASASNYNVNFFAGDLTFTNPPRDGAAIYIEYNHVYWTDDLISYAIKAGLASLFPDFYIPVVEVVESDGETYEYTLTTPEIESIRQIEFSSTSAEPWSIISSKHYERYWDGLNYHVQFYNAPGTGSFRVHAISRPIYGDENILIPDRATPALVSYACYHLLNQKMSQRIRSDTSVNTYGTGTLSPRQMNDAANAFYTRYQLQLASTKMRPWMGR